MSALSQFEIDVNLLKVENQQFTFELNDDFFAELDQNEIHGGSLKASLIAEKVSKDICLHVLVDGEITITCDRCLDDMQQPIHAEDTILVQLGGEQNDQADLYVGDEQQAVDLAWSIYECVALAIPIVHTHTEEACNAEMMAKYREHLAGSNNEKKETDPRWDALKNISKNN